MVFAPLILETLPLVRQLLKEDPRECSEYMPSYTWPWRSRVYTMEFGQSHGCGIYRFHFLGRTYFSIPFGAGDKSAALDELRAHAQAEGLQLRLAPILAHEAARLGPGWLVKPLPYSFDYIYRQRDLAELKGSKYQPKRNHIHRFEDFGPWRYGPVNVADCRTVLREWLKDRPHDEELEIELAALDRIFALPDLMGLSGGILYSNDRPVAFALGEEMSPRTFLASYEKALPFVQGAFPMINREFVRHQGAGYKFVNRAAADGHPNLVKAKESYHPVARLHKYAAIETRVRFATPQDADLIVRLWHTSFGDNEAAIRFFLEQKLAPDNCLLLDDASMAFFLPLPDGKRYLYALCTLPEARGRGLAFEIVRTALNVYFEPLAVCPAEASLVPFYEKFGFRLSAPAIEREVALDDFARRFYTLAANRDPGPAIHTSLPTLTYPPLPGYTIPNPLA
jgi:hypothetical protein